MSETGVALYNFKMCAIRLSKSGGFGQDVSKWTLNSGSNKCKRTVFQLCLRHDLMCAVGFDCPSQPRVAPPTTSQLLQSSCRWTFFILLKPRIVFGKCHQMFLRLIFERGFLMSFPTTFVAFRPKHVIRCIWMLLPSFGGSIRHAASRIRAENLSLSVVIYHLIPRQGSTLLFCTRRLHFKLSFLVCVWKTFTWIVTVNQGIVSPS